MIKRVPIFLGWSLSTFLLLIGLAGFAVNPIIAMSVILWGIIIFPPLLKLTKRYGRTWNVTGRVFIFILSLVIVSQAPQTVNTASEQVKSPQPSIVAKPKVVPSVEPVAAPSVEPSVETPPTVSESPSPDANRRSISKTNFSGEWMLTVDDGELLCVSPKSVVFIAPDGTKYGVNGTAKDFGYPDIRPIWKDNPAIEGTKIDIGSLINEGLKLCE